MARRHSRRIRVKRRGNIRNTPIANTLNPKSKSSVDSSKNDSTKPNFDPELTQITFFESGDDAEESFNGAEDSEIYQKQADKYETSLSLIYGKPGVPEEDEVKKLMSMTTSHPVRIIRDHIQEYPDLGLDVFIAGDRLEEAMFAPLFSRSRCQRAKSVLEADLVVFTGGADVDPQLYGEKCHRSTTFDHKRDSDDMALYMLCYEHGIPMVGVCRGAQFLNVMNGGKLFQDVDGHYGDHSMYDLDNREIIHQVSSVHHQMVYPNPEGGMKIIAVASGKSTKRVGPSPLRTETCKATDIEAFFYRDTCCFGVQGHPEYSGYAAFSIWFLKKINELVITNTDVIWDTSTKPHRRRLDPSIIAERDEGKIKKGAA